MLKTKQNKTNKQKSSLQQTQTNPTEIQRCSELL